MKVICESCGNVFDEDEILVHKERHKELDGYYSEEHSKCPYCGDIDTITDYQEEDE